MTATYIKPVTMAATIKPGHDACNNQKHSLHHKPTYDKNVNLDNI